MKICKVISFGYVRVSTQEQNLERQYTAIKGYRPEIEDVNIFSDKQSGKEFSREGLNGLKAVITQYRKNFIKEELTIEVIIKELDRLGRNYTGIMNELRWFREQGVILRILEIPLTLQEVDAENRWILDMTLNIIIEVYARIAEQEVTKKHQRQMEGLAEAKKKGVKLGRPEIEVDRTKFIETATKAVNGEISHTEAMKQLNLKRNTYYKNLKMLIKKN